MGVDTSDLMNVDTLTLGVFDITPLEMASAYATLAAGGIHYDPVVVSKITNSKGQTVYEDTQEGERVLSESVCGAVTSVLETVFTQSDGTAASARLEGDREVAGKTGTTSDFHDHTLIGYTPDLACACWIGDRFGQITSENLSCNDMFKEFMDAALASTPAHTFPEYKEPEYKNTWNAGLTKSYTQSSGQHSGAGDSGDVTSPTTSEPGASDANGTDDDDEKDHATDPVTPDPDTPTPNPDPTPTPTPDPSTPET